MILMNTETTCQNLHLPDAKNKLRKLHSVLTYQMSNRRQGCINRDKNGVFNIRKLVNYFLKTGKRLHNYSRDVKPENMIAIINSNQQKQEKAETLRLSKCQILEPRSIATKLVKHKARVQLQQITHTT